MKKLFYLFFIGLLSFSMACNSDGDGDESGEQVEEYCKLDLENFRTFCGIENGQSFDDVIELYGEPDSIGLVKNSSYWAYFFIDSHYPLTMEVSDSSGIIWSIYLEILSIPEMEKDIETAIDLFFIDDCMGSLLGEDIEYAENVLGDNYVFEANDAYDSYIYDTKDSSIKVILDFFNEQDSKCTRIMVYFFDQLPSQ